MVDAMRYLESGEQLLMMQAVQHGTLAAHNPKEPHVRRATDQLIRAAHPEPEYPPGTEDAEPDEVM